MTWIFHDITRIMTIQKGFHHTSGLESHVKHRRHGVLLTSGMAFKISMLPFPMKQGFGGLKSSNTEQWKDFFGVISNTGSQRITHLKVPDNMTKNIKLPINLTLFCWQFQRYTRFCSILFSPLFEKWMQVVEQIQRSMGNQRTKCYELIR